MGTYWMFVGMLMGFPVVLLPMHILLINLVTDSLPANALGMEPVESDVMEKKPRPKTEGLFAHGFGVRIVLQGLLFGGLSLLAFYLGKTMTGNIDGGRTLAFMVLALSQVVQSFNMRSEHSLFKIGPFTNKKLNLAALSSVLLVALVLFVPGLNSAFGLIYLEPTLYLIAVALCLAPVVVMEISKALGLIKHKK